MSSLEQDKKQQVDSGSADLIVEKPQEEIKVVDEMPSLPAPDEIEKEPAVGNESIANEERYEDN